jgi:MFS family permease
MLTPSNRVLAHTVPLERRPIFSAIIDGGYSVASSCGSLLGGAITSRLSWRWCFLINAPPGVLCTLTILLAYEDRYIPAGGADRLKTQIARLDLVATLLYALTITCLVLPLQWGGSTFPWSSGQVIALFVLFGVFLAVFISHQLWRGDAAMLPPRVGQNKEMIGAAVYAFFVGGTANVFEYYVSLLNVHICAVAKICFHSSHSGFKKSGPSLHSVQASTQSLWSLALSSSV